MDSNKINKESFIKRFMYHIGKNIINSIKVFGVPVGVVAVIACLVSSTETGDFRPLIICLLIILLGKSLVDATYTNKY